MNGPWSTLVYCLCLLTSSGCAVLLIRGWRRSRSRLLLWTAAGFVLLALNNLALALDKVVFLHTDLWLLRQAAAVAAMGVLLLGFIWEVEE
jgi:hypothetical protein